MANGVNKVTLIGHLGRDPEARQTQSGTTVATLTLATTEKVKGPGGNGWVDETEWHRLVAFGTTADNCVKYLNKGSQIYVEGRLKTRKWTNKEGHDVYTTEIMVSDLKFLGKPSGEQKSQTTNPNHQSTALPPNQGMDKQAMTLQANNNMDDIPF